MSQLPVLFLHFERKLIRKEDREFKRRDECRQPGQAAYPPPKFGQIFLSSAPAICVAD